MRQALILVALAFVLSQCTNAADRLAKKDFTKWCEIAGEININDYEDKVTGVVTYNQKVNDTIRSPEVMTVYREIQEAGSNKARLAMIKKAAAEVGLKNFNCPAFERMYPVKDEQNEEQASLDE